MGRRVQRGACSPSHATDEGPGFRGACSRVRVQQSVAGEGEGEGEGEARARRARRTPGRRRGEGEAKSSAWCSLHPTRRTRRAHARVFAFSRARFGGVPPVRGCAGCVTRKVASLQKLVDLIRSSMKKRLFAAVFAIGCGSSKPTATVTAPVATNP